MRIYLNAFVVLCVLLVSGVCFAQDDAKITSISFEEDRIEGDLMVPNYTCWGMFSPEVPDIIRVREDFVDEMRKSTEEI